MQEERRAGIGNVARSKRHLLFWSAAAVTVAADLVTKAAVFAATAVLIIHIGPLRDATQVAPALALLHRYRAAPITVVGNVEAFMALAKHNLVDEVRSLGPEDIDRLLAPGGDLPDAFRDLPPGCDSALVWGDFPDAVERLREAGIKRVAVVSRAELAVPDNAGSEALELSVNRLLRNRNGDVIPGLLTIVVRNNPGGVFGLFEGHRRALIAVSLAALVFVLWLYLSDKTRRLSWALALGLIFGGAIGNLVDRLWLGSVRDFIDVHVGAYHWPAFNLADAALCVGAALVAWRTLWPPKTPAGESTPPEDSESAGEHDG